MREIRYKNYQDLAKKLGYSNEYRLEDEYGFMFKHIAYNGEEKVVTVDGKKVKLVKEADMLEAIKDLEKKGELDISGYEKIIIANITADFVSKRIKILGFGKTSMKRYKIRGFISNKELEIKEIEEV